jgi:hypothetical protein
LRSRYNQDSENDYRDSIGRRVTSIDQFSDLSEADQQDVREKYAASVQRERYAAWDESKHPRDDSGQFGSGGGQTEKSEDTNNSNAKKSSAKSAVEPGYIGDIISKGGDRETIKRWETIFGMDAAIVESPDVVGGELPRFAQDIIGKADDGGKFAPKEGGASGEKGGEPKKKGGFDPNPPQTGPFDAGSPHGDAYDEVVKSFPGEADMGGRLIIKGYTVDEAKTWLQAKKKGGEKKPAAKKVKQMKRGVSVSDSDVEQWKNEIESGGWEIVSQKPDANEPGRQSFVIRETEEEAIRRQEEKAKEAAEAEQRRKDPSYTGGAVPGSMKGEWFRD